jgi:GGDEF domain-containing protein
VLLSGLPEDVFTGLPLVPVLVLKASLGPLSGAMVLTYLNQWLGVAAEDRMVHHTIVWGSVSLVFAAVLLTVLSSLFANQQSSEILLMAASVNALSVLLATLTSVRAAHLGDKMARSMVVGCLFLAVSVAGLYSHQLGGDNFDLPVIVLTSFSTVVFFLVMVSLGIRHNQAVRRLEHLAGLSQGMDPATGLPRGSLLLSKVDDAFWRSARLNASCTVICLHLRNLYELSEDAGHGVEQQILSSMAARIRRAVGFRCVVGLYHPRCFVVVLSALKHPKSGDTMGERMRALVSKPMELLGQNETLHVFTPHLSVGSVTVSAASAIPGHVIDEAEQLALASEREKPSTRSAHGALMAST